MSRVDLPDGQWAELFDPKKLSERRRRPYLSAMTAYTSSLYTLPLNDEGKPDSRAYGPAQDDLLNGAVDLLVVGLVKAWSFEFPIETDALLDLPTDTFDALRVACLALRDDLMPDYSTSPDPKAPTAE